MPPLGQARLIAALERDCVAAGVRYELRVKKGSLCAWSAEVRLVPRDGIDGEADVGELFYVTGGAEPAEPVAVAVAAARDVLRPISRRRAHRPQARSRRSTRAVPRR